MQNKGMFKAIKNGLFRHKLGELLLAKDLISASELRRAMREHRQTKTPLGEVLVRQSVISQNQLRYILCKQTALRVCVAILFFGLSLTVNDRRARADSLQTPVSMSKEFARVTAYPALFGTREEKSTNLSAFTKWTQMFSRFDRQLKNPGSAQSVQDWQQKINALQSPSIKTMADRVNDLVNEKRYILDSKNWGQSDYWATPVEFIERGGDCEDFAIMKYVALRSLGVPEERLRVAIVQDLQKNIPHAVLIVYTEDGAYFLDNQIKNLVSAETGTRYRPIYSINRQAWWLHKDPSKTIIASAQ